jgi:hypothetical protein
VQGVRQQLEKKEGLFRMNMMGKRVNYAARSVISPDPYIGAGALPAQPTVGLPACGPVQQPVPCTIPPGFAIASLPCFTTASFDFAFFPPLRTLPLPACLASNWLDLLLFVLTLLAGEIGVPPYFAMRLSFPEAVTPHNVEHLRQLVRNGAHKYPGALAVEDCTGRVIQLSRLDEKQRDALAKQLMLPSFTAGVKQGPAGRAKTVYRYAGRGEWYHNSPQAAIGLQIHHQLVNRVLTRLLQAWLTMVT